MKPRNQQVEGLRGFAILLILVYHAFFRFNQLYCANEINWMRNFGNFGVVLFLLISCYYLVDFNSKISHFHLFKFWIKKFLRLWPCYILSITITTIIMHIFLLPNRMSTGVDWLLNIFFINGFIGTPYVDGAHWYLTVLIGFIIVMGVGVKLYLYKNVFFYYGLILLFLLAGKLHIKIITVLLGGVLLHPYYCLCNKIFYTEKRHIISERDNIMGIVGVY